MPFSEEFKRFFKFSFSERRGLFFLCALLSLFIVLSRLSNLIIYNKSNSEAKTFVVDSNNFVSAELDDSIPLYLNKKPDFSKSFQTEKVNQKKFDPNTASISDLKDVGFYPKIAERLVKFRENGGQFKTKEDLRKVFGVTEKFYASIFSQIEIKTTRSKLENEKGLINTESINTNILGKYEAHAQLKNIDINKVNFKTLLKITNDSVISSKILKYKFSLGGYYHLDQLSEISLLSDSIRKRIQPIFVIQEDNVFKKINLNLAEESELKFHPYIKNKLAKLIVAYRQNHPFLAIEDLKKLPLVDLTLFEKLKPYVFVSSIE